MDVELLFFDGCPNWRTADQRLREALRQAGHADVAVRHRRIETPEQAEAAGFAGSPTVLVDGADPFAEHAGPAGLSCRVYQTPQGPAGSPTVAQLLDALRAAS